MPGDPMIGDDDESSVRRSRSMREVFERTGWLSAEEVASRPMSEWSSSGRIFGVKCGGEDYYARFQFDAHIQPRPVIADILAAYGERADPWVLAAWFHYPNAWLSTGVHDVADGSRCLAPKDCLDNPAAVVAAASKRRSTYVA